MRITTLDSTICFSFCDTSKTCHHDDRGIILDYLQNSCSLHAPLTGFGVLNVRNQIRRLGNY